MAPRKAPKSYQHRASSVSDHPTSSALPSSGPQPLAAARPAAAERDEAPRRSVLAYLWSEGWVPSIVSVLALVCAAYARRATGGADGPVAAADALQAFEACPGRTTPDTTSLYTLLGVPREFDDAELRNAYRRLSLKWHPDKNRACSAAPAVFAEVARAYKVLSTPELRDVYDRLGNTGLQRLQDGDPSVAKDWVPPDEALRRHGYSAETLQRRWSSLDDIVTNIFAWLAGL